MGLAIRLTDVDIPAQL